MLNYKSLGAGPPVFILHGLFGSSDNWRSFARLLSSDFQVIAVDLRNHGRSFWSDEFNYSVIAEDVIVVMDHLDIEKAHFIGHSMGGKTVLTLANRFNDRVQKLVVIDICHKAYSPGHLKIFESLLSIDTGNLTSRGQADEILKKDIPEISVRQFLLKSLGRNEEGKFKWKTNFNSLYQNYDQVLAEIIVADITAEILFVRGTKSLYITDEDVVELRSTFKNVRIADLDSGHWIHVERPEELFRSITSFLN